jgi:hypothetical protein
MTRPGLPMKFINEAMGYFGEHCRLWPYALNSAGYGHLVLGGKNILAHRLICEMAYGPAPAEKPEAAHLCGNGHKGCINRTHLEWKSRKSNAEDMVAHGRSCRGEKHYMARLTEEKVRFIRSNAETMTIEDFMQKFDVSRGVIHHALKRNSWAWVKETA